MTRKNRKIIFHTRINNSESGVALIISLFVLTILFGLTAGFSLSSVGELNNANRFRDSTSSFWAAESAINRYISNNSLLNAGAQNYTIGNSTVSISKVDETSVGRTVTAVANTNGVNRSIEVFFAAGAPDLFNNTISSGGDINLNGLIAGLQVDGKTRLSGEFNDNGFLTSGSFEDKQENVASTNTTLQYPDADGNGTGDEFTDFVAYNRQFADTSDPNYSGEYSDDEVLYIQSNDTVNLWPNEELVGKKVVFVEGATAGSGDVNVWFDTTWAADQDITIISTGSVNYIQPLTNPASNSQLNTISYDDYNEVAILYSTHSGATYTHDQANFGSIVSYSHTTGNMVANTSMRLDLILVWKEFDFENPVADDGSVPPAFQGLIAASSGGYASTPTSWEEI